MARPETNSLKAVCLRGLARLAKMLTSQIDIHILLQIAHGSVTLVSRFAWKLQCFRRLVGEGEGNTVVQTRSMIARLGIDEMVSTSFCVDKLIQRSGIRQVSLFRHVGMCFP